MAKIKKKLPKLIHHEQQILTTTELVERYKSVPFKENTIRNWRNDGNGPPWKRKGDAPRAPVIYLMKDILAWEKKHLAWFIPPEVV